METAIYWKSTNTDIYMHWNSHAPSSWKIATLKNLVQRATIVSSTKQALEEDPTDPNSDMLKHSKNRKHIKWAEIAVFKILR